MDSRRLIGIHGGKRRGIAWRTLAGARIVAGSLFAVAVSSSTLVTRRLRPRG